ncbi:hypothetical protein IV454_02500 [Massilia antarctica]|uniref:Uncharacterized protein n=1 Tax=Massilia antarctica TaxID=2765360 RepID=A0AA48WEI3_9BURK|nr:hypothetical protein [Massilia antarctica]QPI50511.1 hypothetical protein IV454_02500 [Massilia antarctica]
MEQHLRRHWLASILLGSCLLLLVWAAMAPIPPGSRDFLLDIPEHAAERRLAGERAEVLPPVVRLTVGLRDVLLLRNSDKVPHQVGGLRLMPGQQFRLPFERATELQLPCSARVSGELTVLVGLHPNPGPDRLRWRLHALEQAVRAY